jgi:hypothetical protein
MTLAPQITSSSDAQKRYHQSRSGHIEPHAQSVLMAAAPKYGLELLPPA